MIRKTSKGLTLAAFGLALALVVFTALEVAGVITLRIFASLCIVAMIVAYFGFVRVLKSAATLARPPEERPRLSDRKRWYALSGAILWVVLAFWLTRGGPWLPRLVGATVVVVFIAPLILRRRG